MLDRNDIHAQRLLIVDFGSQYTQLIARRIRECGVYCEIYPFDVSADAINELAPMGVILSGSPESVTEQSTPRIDQSIFDLRVPVLGICYGMQAMAQQFGGAVSGSDLREFGHAEVRGESDSAFIDTLLQVQDGQNVWMSHGDQVQDLPDDFDLIAATAGRSFWILDDLSPLQQHQKTEQIHLVAPKTSYRISSVNTPKNSSQGSNPKSGVYLDYYLPEVYDSLEVQLDILQDEKVIRSYTSSKNSDFKSWPGGPNAELVLPHKIGFNRTHWDFRRAQLSSCIQYLS